MAHQVRRRSSPSPPKIFTAVEVSFLRAAVDGEQRHHGLLAKVPRGFDKTQASQHWEQQVDR